MDIQSITAFFKWCTIINIVVFACAALMFLIAPGLVYKTQTWLFPISREAFHVVFYSFLALYKICILIFNVVPYAALVIVGKKGI